MAVHWDETDHLSDEFGIQGYDVPDPGAQYSQLILMTPVSGSYNIDLIFYSSLRLLVGPIQVISEYMFMIKTVLLMTVMHLFLDMVCKHANTKSRAKDIATCIFGLYQLRSFLVKYSQSHPRLMAFTVFSIVLLTILTRIVRSRAPNKSTIGILLVLAFIASPIYVNEYLIYRSNRHDHTILRAVLMILVMKATSESLQSSSHDSPTIIETLSYLLNPATIVLGPWHARHPHSFKMAGSSTDLCLQYLRKFKQAVFCFFKTFCILTISTNLSELSEYITSMTTDTSIERLSEIYFIALEFRFSHYFACFLSLTLLNLSQTGDTIQVCKMKTVEWPRSLVEVVVSWNIPMHLWLKDNIFNPLRRSQKSIILAVIITYLCSSTLHGFKFHIWAVLLSLGVASWIEHGLRQKLATRYSICVLARPCSLATGQTCTRHRRKTGNSATKELVINGIFRAATILQLAYLGSIFVGNTDVGNYREALQIWADTYYVGHVLIVTMFILKTIL